MQARSLATWIAVVIPIWLVFVLGTYWEPILRDSWGHLWWHERTDVSLVDFAKDTYLHNNPRIGQVLTWLLVTPGPWHVIVTPLVELLLFFLLAALVLGRWPSLRRTDDALLIAILVGMVLVTCPLVGPMLFYRPFTGNYLYGLVLNLLFLVPFRLHLVRPLTARWLVPVMGIAGLASGLANEHTGPAVTALCAVACVVAWRRGTLRPWLVVGLAGMLAGGALLYFAPGQNMRYEGLATQQSVLGRIADRGADNLEIITELFRYVRSLALWLVVAGIGYAVTRKRPPLAAALVLGATALAITLTLLASPKQGPRLYLASIVFACAAVSAVVLPQLQAWWLRALAWALAAGFALRTAIPLVQVYADIGPVAHDRLERILSARPGAVLELPAYPRPRSRYFIGDDLAYDKWRRHVAESFGLAEIRLIDAAQRPATTPADAEP